MPVTQHPPHSSRRAALPHRALASGHDAPTWRGIGMQDVGGRQPLGGEGVYPLPGDPMALTASSERLTPIAEDTFATHPQHAHVARHSIIPIIPREYTLEPCPKLPNGPVHPLPQGLFDPLQRIFPPILAQGEQCPRVSCMPALCCSHSKSEPLLRFLLEYFLAIYRLVATMYVDTSHITRGGKT